ncbi:2470_t:CDS:1, partial [Entrophospora sp. SA101]
WTYLRVEKTNNNNDKKSPSKALKSKHLDFEEQFMSSNSKRKATSHIRES